MTRHPPYNNACLNVTNRNTPDPFFVFAHGKFYLTFTANDRIPMWEADSLLDFWQEEAKSGGEGEAEGLRGYRRGAVWIPPPDTNVSARLWAPELHAIHNRWYIYFAAMHPATGNRSHRMYVLGGPPSNTSPHSGPWEFLGPIQGMDQRHWAIDGTVFSLNGGRLYFVYSGWPLDRPRDDYDEREQRLFILELSDPVTAGSGAVMICKPEHVWERTGEVGICEGPQWLASPDGGGVWRGLVYSCGASWTEEYKMATLKYLGGSPLEPNNWFKAGTPLLQNSDSTEGPWAPGHGNFLDVGGETLALFHGTDTRDDGGWHRKARMQRVVWTREGPFMGGVVGDGTRDLDRFLGGSQTGSLERILRGGGSGL